MRVEALRLFTSNTARHQIVLTRKLPFETQVIIGTVAFKCVFLPEMTRRLHDFKISGQFVAQRKHDERSMMAVFLLNAQTLFAQIRNQTGVVLPHPSPERQFGLQIYSFDVGGFKAGFGRTPGMETIVVDAVRFTATRK